MMMGHFMATYGPLHNNLPHTPLTIPTTMRTHVLKRKRGVVSYIKK